MKSVVSLPETKLIFTREKGHIWKVITVTDAFKFSQNAVPEREESSNASYNTKPIYPAFIFHLLLF